MLAASHTPLLTLITAGSAIFTAEMPVWLSHFGDQVWRFMSKENPLYQGESTSSIVWQDYVDGRGSTIGGKSSFSMMKYHLCLTNGIVQDLKVAAVIYSHFPKLLKHSRATKASVTPATVKGRIEDLAKFFSFLILDVKKNYGICIENLSDIDISMINEVVTRFPPNIHLKRALKLISDPIVQKNLSKPLQWSLYDVTHTSIQFAIRDNPGHISTLSDEQFLVLLDRCKKGISDFKTVAGLAIHDVECAASVSESQNSFSQSWQDAVAAFYDPSFAVSQSDKNRRLLSKFGIQRSRIASLVSDAHTSAMMLILLFTGMRLSDSKFLKVGCLNFRLGYWFLESKLVKGKPKDQPVSEGWLAIDIVRDAYEVLMFMCKATGNSYLFSAQQEGHALAGNGYRGGALNTKFIRWIETFDTELFDEYKFSVHQCRETLVFQMAKQEVGLPFISMQLKHFHSRFVTMPNDVTANYGNYRTELMNSITGRMAEARQDALLDLYGEDARFAGGGATEHKARIDAFFVGLGLYGINRELYIKKMAVQGASHMPTSIGSCTKNFVSSSAKEPDCYGDYQCDPKCGSHVITERSAKSLIIRREHALNKAETEPSKEFKVIWISLADKLSKHIDELSV
jgi:hypothetical protein